MTSGYTTVVGRSHQTEMVACSVFRFRSLRAFDRYVFGAQYPTSVDIEFVHDGMHYGLGAACTYMRSSLDTSPFLVDRLCGERRRRPVRPVQLPVKSSMSPATTRRRPRTRRRRQHPVSIFCRHQQTFVRTRQVDPTQYFVPAACCGRRRRAQSTSLGILRTGLTLARKRGSNNRYSPQEHNMVWGCVAAFQTH